jgi:hypothetical protein
MKKKLNEIVKLGFIPLLFVIFILPAASLNQISEFSINASNYPNLIVGFKEDIGFMVDISQKLDQEYFTVFRFGQGFNTIQFQAIESTENPGFYWRHFQGMIRLAKYKNNDQFFEDASFKAVPGLANPSNKDYVSFESKNFPGHYIRHRNMKLFLDKNDDSDLFRNDATFLYIKPITQGLHVVNFLFSREAITVFFCILAGLAFFLLDLFALRKVRKNTIDESTTDK